MKAKKSENGSSFDVLEYNSDGTSAVVKTDIYLMDEDPLPDSTPNDVLVWYDNHQDEAGLADAFAAVSNKYWWIAGDLDFFDRKTLEFEEALRITKEWEAVHNKLERKICGILKKEGYRIPRRGRIHVLVHFMARYGYQNGSGWWIRTIPGESMLLS